MLLTDLLDEIGYSYSEGDFRSDTRPPYIAWDRDTDEVTANSTVIYSAEWAILHLVHAKSDFESEKKVERILYEHGISYTKDSTWVGGSQRSWIITYELAEGAV